MGHPLGGSSQHHAHEVISGFQDISQPIPATKPHLPLALQIPLQARGQAKEGGELWAQGVQVQTGGGIQHVCEEPVCSLTSSWLGKSTGLLVWIGTVSSSDFRKSSPLPTFGGGCCWSFRAGWCQYLNLCFKVGPAAGWEERRFFGGWEGASVDVVAVGAWGRRPHRSGHYVSAGFGPVPNLQPAALTPLASSTSPSPCLLPFSFFL